jgi:N-acyl-D-amino-acid deacylase
MPAQFDAVIRGGRVIDGSGRPAAAADVGLRGDRIAAIGAIARGAGEREIDAAGKVVAPGFIDVHTHDDRALLATPDMSAKASQGVTTVVTGNCGVSLAPLVCKRAPPPPLDLIGDQTSYRYPRLADYTRALDAAPAALNAACLVGHTTLRVGAMADLERPATDEEIDAMRTRLAEALDDGAIGLSSGTFYAPAAAAPASEVAALADLVGRAGGVYTTHMRDEADEVLASLDESFAIGRQAGVPVVISHHKVTGRNNFGRSRETLEHIARAMAGQPVGLDAYPYVAASSVLNAARAAQSDKVLIAWSKPHPEAAGRELADLAAEWRASQAEAVERLKPGGAVYFVMDEADVRRILSFEHTMIGSDGLPHDVHPHPRLWGTFPRVLGHYVRDAGLFTLEEAVRRMTSLPAGRFGLANRGSVAEGAYADLVVFDRDAVGDRATFAKPTIASAGIDAVLVNGQAIWRNGAPTGARPGRALRRQDQQREARR